MQYWGIMNRARVISLITRMVSRKHLLATHTLGGVPSETSDIRVQRCVFYVLVLVRSICSSSPEFHQVNGSWATLCAYA